MPHPSPGKGQETKMVVLVRRPDGSCQVVAFERDSPLPENFSLIGSERITSKSFPKMPKRLSFFFEKNFSNF